VDPKTELLRALQVSRAVVTAKLDGLSEYDVRRPLAPTGTNLLGLVKHLAGLEYGYLGESFGRPPVERPVVDVYRKACAHADTTVTSLELNSPGYVAHWAAGHRETTLGVLLIRMVAETSQHAGHADILREQLDGRISGDTTVDAAFWDERRAQVQAAADPFRP
jgi:hypothetical protein